MRVRRIWPAALIVLSPVVTGCATDDDTDRDAAEPIGSATTDTSSATTSAPTSSAPTSQPPPTTTPTSSATGTAPAAPLPDPCTVVSAVDVQAAYGVTFSEGTAVATDHRERGSSWTSAGCAFTATDLVEVTVELVGPDDFTAGKFGCVQPPEQGSIIEPVDDLAGADRGWWRTSDAPPLAATMRACTSTVLLDVDLVYEDGVDYEGDPRNQSAALAEKVLARLP